MSSVRLLLPLAAMLSFLPAAAQPIPSPTDEVIAAEREFAAFTRDHGFKRGFLAFAAPDAMVFQPGPVPARPGLEALPDAVPPGPPLQWWPQFAGAAASGDLGFTSGGASIPVRYFTVWQRQPDGGWKWIYDGGSALSAAIPSEPGDPVLRLPPATAAAGSAEAALAEIAPLETAIAEAAASDAATARRLYLASEALVAGSRTASHPGAAEQAAELARQPARQWMRPLGARASRAGDMVFTWGEVRFGREDRPRWGHYARIWQKRSEGWRLVADIEIAAPGEPPRTPAG